jgi:hypothetical protein
MKLGFYISEYEDGNMTVETHHMHYTFREDINFDDFPPEELKDKIKKIKNICESEHIIPYFQWI